ncbi:hypothetical protein GCM10022280_20210 [Sphingomonas swuensis]|uniref:Uncharacterized protein n=1 Tax=Sphingomonas swuensis TaxID=977800 RepID=A0ABP7T2X0_9SPHN
MTILGAFVSALVMTALHGAIANFIFKRFASPRIAAVAAFWLAFGAAGGRYAYAGAPSVEVLIALAAVGGAGLALFLLWYGLLRRPPAVADAGEH